MINYNELLPVFLTGIICGIIACLERFKDHLKSKNPDAETESESNEVHEDFKVHLLITDFVKNTLYSTGIACFIFWLSALVTDNYQIRLGITGIVSILGLDKAIALVEKFASLKSSVSNSK